MPVAIGALAGLDAVAAAIVTLLLFLAALALVIPLSLALGQLLRQLPVYGDDLANLVINGAQSLSDSITNFLSQTWTWATQPITDVMNGSANTSRFNAYSQRLVSLSIVAQMNQLTFDSKAGISTAVTDCVYQTAVAEAQRTDAEVASGVATSVNYTQSSYVALAGWANSAIQQVYGQTQDVSNALDSDVAQLNTRIEDVNAGLGQDIADTAATVLSVTDERLQTGLGELRGEAVTEHNNIVDYIGATRDYVLEQASDMIGPVGVLAATTAITLAEKVEPAINELEDFNKNCGIPVCDNLLNFAKGFLGLTDLIGDFALAGFLISAVTSPADVAKETANDVGELVGDARDTIGSLFGKHF